MDRVRETESIKQAKQTSEEGDKVVKSTRKVKRSILGVKLEKDCVKTPALAEFGNFCVDGQSKFRRVIRGGIC